MTGRRSSRVGAGGRRGTAAAHSRLRITGGGLRGRRLEVPAAGVRPSSDRVRESLFARLSNLEGARALDLFAGSGALGIESISRGASSVVFVEHSREVAAVLQSNLETLELTDRAEVLKADCLDALRRLGRAGQQFELLLLDPPYDAEVLIPSLEAIVAAHLLAPEALVVVETSKRHAVLSVPGLSLVDEREYGDTRLTRLVEATCS